MYSSGKKLGDEITLERILPYLEEDIHIGEILYQSLDDPYHFFIPFRNLPYDIEVALTFRVLREFEPSKWSKIKFEKGALSKKPLYSMILKRTDQTEPIQCDATNELPKEMILKPDFVMLVGGLAVNERTEGDIDILIRTIPNEPQFAVELQASILNKLPKFLWDRVHFLWDFYHGPFTSYLPLYHLAVVKEATPELVPLEVYEYLLEVDL